MQTADAVSPGAPTTVVRPPGDGTHRDLDGIELRDWKVTHRNLSPRLRGEARAYIIAIICRDPFVRESSPVEQQRAADGLWRRFRDLYDAPHHGEREDFARAMRLM